MGGCTIVFSLFSIIEFDIQSKPQHIHSIETKTIYNKKKHPKQQDKATENTNWPKLRSQTVDVVTVIQ